MGTLTTSLSGADLRRRLPKPIWRRLWAMVRRARRMTLLKGFFVVLTTALLCLLGIMAVDAVVTLFSRALRLGLSLGALSITLGAAWWWMVRPAFRRIDFTGVARMVEERHPELEETVSSAVEFLASDDPDEIRGSQELIGEVVKSAVRDVDKISPRREFDGRAARPWGLSALAIVLLLGLVGVLWPKPALRLLWRAVAPLHDVGNAYADTLQVTPGDARVAAGSDVTIELSIRHPRLKRATVLRQEGVEQPEGVERMNLVGTDEQGVTRFSLVLPAVQKEFTYRVHAGQALSRRFAVQVVEPPRVEGVTVRYEYPAYTGLEAREEACQNGEIVALEHSQVRVRAAVSEPVKEALLVRDGNVAKAAPADLADGAHPEWNWVMGRRVNQGWEMRFQDEEGFSSQPVSGQIRSLADEEPEVRLVSPEARELRLRPSEYLPLSYQAQEDFGFARAELLVRLEGQATPVLVSVALPQAAGAKMWAGKAGLPLSDLDLDQVRQFTVQLRLVDNLPEEWGGGQEALSEVVTVRVERGAKSLVEQVLESQEQEIRREMDKARQELQTAKARGEESARAFARDPVSALKRLEDARSSVAQAEQRMEELGAKMERTAFADRAKDIQEIASGPVRQARERAESAPLTDRPEERDQQLQEMSRKLGEAVERMSGVLANLQKSKDEARKVAELARLAQEQQRLAQEAKRELAAQEMAKALEPEEEAPVSQPAGAAAQALAAWKREQEQLQKEMAEMLRKDGEALRAAMEAFSGEAKAMAKEAESLRGEQKKLEELTAAMEKASEAQAAEKLRRQLLEHLKTEEESIERQTRALRQEVSAQHPAASAAQEQLAGAAEQAEQAAREMGRNEVAQAKAAAERAREQLQKVAGEAREELAKEAIRDKAEQAMKGAMAEAGKVSEPVAEALDGLARDLAEKLVESPWPADRPVSLEQKLGEAVESVKQAVAEQRPAPPAEPGEEKAATGAGEALARAVTEKGEELMRRWEAEIPEGAKGADPGKKPAGTAMPADPQAVENLSRLAERQESVARALQALERGQLGEAMAERQQALAAEAASLSGEAEGLQKAVANSQNQARSQADQARSQLDQAEKQAMAAARDLGRAQQAQDQKQAEQAMASAAGAMSAAEALEKARSESLTPAPATESEKSALRSTRQAQQRSSEALAQAAQRLSGTGESLAAGARAARPGGQNPPSGMVAPKELARSYTQVSQAARAEDAAAAASRAADAAENLRDMTWKMAERMGNLGNWAESLVPGETAEPSAETAGARGKAAQAGGAGTAQFGAPQEAVRGDGVPPGMAKWGVSAEEWAKLKGSLGSNVTQEVQAGMPLDYRGLVGDYFRALAEEARKNPDEGSGEKK